VAATLGVNVGTITTWAASAALQGGRVYPRDGMDGMVRASVRVTGASPDQPFAERARLAGEQLSRLGFEVLRCGRRGVSIKGDPVRFEEIFGVHPEPGKALTREVRPRVAELENLVDYIEVAPEPIPFGKSSSDLSRSGG
jgi:hypothetical protein